MPASLGSRRAADESRVASRSLPCWSLAHRDAPPAKWRFWREPRLATKGHQHACTGAGVKGGRMRFQDKVALITAAASGIGRASADIMGREGAIIVAVDNNEERLDRAVRELGKEGGRAHGRLCDALDAAQVDALVARVAREFGRIDILVNAVGGSTLIAKSGATVDELSFADWQRLIDFNLSGTFLFTHAVVPVMKRRK